MPVTRARTSTVFVLPYFIDVVSSISNIYVNRHQMAWHWCMRNNDLWKVHRHRLMPVIEIFHEIKCYMNTDNRLKENNHNK